MTTFRASVRVDDGTLHTSRPLTAPERVADLIDDIAAQVGGDVLSIDVTVETVGESDTPIGDSVVGTSSTPLVAAELLDDDDDVPASPAQVLS